MRLIDADTLTADIKKQSCNNCENWSGIRCKSCDVDDILCMIDNAPFYSSLEDFIEKHGEEIDFMFFAPELESDGDANG